MAERFKVGGDCDTWCTKCKMLLAHTIEAMVDGVPIKVICNTCGGRHRYRAPKASRLGTGLKRRGSGSGSKSRSDRARARSAGEVRGRWEMLMEERKGAAFQPYSPKSGYEKDAVLKHPKFGLGVVLETIGDEKVRVIFRDGEKVLITNYGR